MGASKYTYTRIQELSRFVDNKVNVYGVVTYNRKEEISATSRTQTIFVCDETTGVNSPLRCIVKLQPRTDINTYKSPDVGTVVRFHRMKVNPYRDGISGYVHQAEDILQFCFVEDGKYRCVTSAAKFTRCNEDNRRAIQLHNWFKQQRKPTLDQDSEHNENVLTFSQIHCPGFINICVQVIAVVYDDLNYPNQVLLRVWDGTKLNGLPLISHLPKNLNSDIPEDLLKLTDGYAVDLMVYDNHMATALKLKTQDSVYIRNVLVLFKNDHVKFRINGLGIKWQRGIWPITEAPPDNGLQERLLNVRDNFKDTSGPESPPQILQVEDVSDIEAVDESCAVRTPPAQEYGLEIEIEDLPQVEIFSGASCEITTNMVLMPISKNRSIVVNDYCKCFRVIPLPHSDSDEDI